MGSASRSSFFGFEIAKTGLFISQHNLNVTGHNISNVNTPGYTRQRLITSALEPYSTIGKLASLEHGILGGGTRSHYIEQLRNTYLDREFRMQNSSMNTWQSRLNGLEFIEQIFDEPTEVGVLSHLQDFHNAISDLATKSTGQEHRTALQTAAQNLTTTFNEYYRQLVTQQDNLNDTVEDKVGEVNDYAERIGELNKLIYAFEISGEHANDLRDDRNLLLDELSALVEIEVEEYKTVDHEPARLRVSIGKGASKGDLVNHRVVNQLHLEEVANSIQEDAAAPNVVGDPVDTVWAIMWANAIDDPNDPNDNQDGLPVYKATAPPHGSGTPTANIERGTQIYDDPPTHEQMQQMYDLIGEGDIKGSLTLRDGDDSENMGIPYFVHELDKLARAIVQEFNKIHMSGWSDVKAKPNGSETGLDFFNDFGLDASDDAADFSIITAGNFQLDELMVDPEDVWRIACSDKQVTETQEGNNKNTIAELLDRFDDVDVPVVGNFSDFYDSFLLAVGATTTYSRTQQTSRLTLAMSADTQRMSISAVSIDEEVTNMVKFQHAYAASSRVITAMDEALDRLINSTGVVGR